MRDDAFSFDLDGTTRGTAAKLSKYVPDSLIRPYPLNSISRPYFEYFGDRYRQRTPRRAMNGKPDKMSRMHEKSSISQSNLSIPSALARELCLLARLFGLLPGVCVMVCHPFNVARARPPSDASFEYHALK